MAVKPSNVVNQLRDKVILSPVIDLSAATATLVPPLFVDPVHKWQVWMVSFLATVDYIAAQATNVNVGTFADPDAFVDDVSLGVDLISAGDLGDALAIEEDSRVLEVGEPLVVGHVQNGSQSGEGLLVIRLRAMDQQPFATKRPQDARAVA